MLDGFAAILLDHAAPIRANCELPVEVVDGIEKKCTCKQLPDATWINIKGSHVDGLVPCPFTRQEGMCNLTQIETSGRRVE